MNNEYKKRVGDVVGMLLDTEAKKATKYVSPVFVVTATRKVYGGKINKRDKSVDIVLKIGKPNFAEREFIKLCKEAKEPFPVKRIQIKDFPKKK